MNSFMRNLVVWVVLGTLMIYVFNNIENSSAREQISYSQFKQEVLSDRIAKVVYKGDQMTIIGDRLDGTKFETKMESLLFMKKLSNHQFFHNFLLAPFL